MGSAMSDVSIRQATSDDHDALCHVSLLTGDAGGDATGREDEPDLIGLFYAVPYQVAAPDFAFVLTQSGMVCGYVLGAPDTPVFLKFMETVWLPPLRGRIGMPPSDPDTWKGSDWIRDEIHRPQDPPPIDLTKYPAHGHIDLLPCVRGQGHGRRAMSLLEARMQVAGVTGLSLAVAEANDNAQAFYARLGYRRIDDAGAQPGVVYLGKQL